MKPHLRIPYLFLITVLFSVGCRQQSETEPLFGFNNDMVTAFQDKCPAVKIIYLAGRFESYAN